MTAAAAQRATVRATGYIVLVAAVAAIGGFLFGFDTAVINGAVSAVQAHFHVGPVALGLSVSGALVGAAIGALTAGRLADHFGRVPTMIVAAILFLVQSFGVGLSFTIVDFTFWRVVGGVAVGAASVIAPAYIAESAPAELRGRLGSFQQLAIVVGIFIALLADFAIAAAAGGAARTWLLGLPAWRWMFLSEVIPSLIYLVGALQIPESPRYLVAVKRVPEARLVLEQIVGSARVEAKILEIQQTLAREHKPSFSDLRGRYGLLPIVWVGIGLSVFQQFVGINVIFYYSSVLWQAVGFTEKQSLEITVITGLTNIVTTLVAIATIDRFGRKPLLLIGSFGMAVTLGTMAYLFGTAPLDAAGQPRLQGANGTIALVAANVYVFFFGMSWGPVVWVLLGEMFPNRIRAAALGLGAALQWVANFVVSATFPTLKNAGLGYAYGLYALAAVLSFLFVLALIRETRGRELETMTESLRHPESPPGGTAGGALNDLRHLRLLLQISRRCVRRRQKYVVVLKARADERAALADRIAAAVVHGHQDQTRRKRDQCVPSEPILARIMQRVVLTAPVEADLEVLRTLLGRWLDAEDATVRQEREPHGRPGDRHWHLARSGKGGGTLEVTFVRRDPSRIEVDVHANRRGGWSGPAQQRLVAFLERELAPRSRPSLGRSPPDPCNSPPEPHGPCSDAEAIAFVLEQAPATPAAGSSRSADTWPASILTRREMEIVRLSTTGLTSRQIAGRLLILERTVTTHVTNMFNKLGLGSRIQLASWVAVSQPVGANDIVFDS